FAMITAAWPLAAAAQDAPQVRVQAGGARSYLAVQIKAAHDLRIPRTQRQAPHKIALHALGPDPRPPPPEAAARHAAWQFSNDVKTIEFLGVAGSEKSGRFRLLYPVAAGWKEVELAIDFATAGQAEDIKKRWAAAWAREFAVRERLAADAVEFRSVRRELCRTYSVVDPMPRPPTGAE